MSTKLKDNIRPYQAKNGKTQFKPSIQLVMVMRGDNEGFCLACGETQAGVEPDAQRYTCESCKAPKVYGAEVLVEMGLVFEA